MLLPFYLLLYCKINSTLIIIISGLMFYLIVNGFYYIKKVLAYKKLVNSKVEISSDYLSEINTQIKLFSAELGFKIPPKAYLVSVEGKAEIYIIKGIIYITTDMIELLKNKIEARNFIFAYVFANILRADYFDMQYFVYLKRIPVFGFLSNYFLRENVYSYDRFAVLLCGNKEGALHFFEAVYPNARFESARFLEYNGNNTKISDFILNLNELQRPFPSVTNRLAKINNQMLASKTTKTSIFLSSIVAMVFPNFTVKPATKMIAFILLVNSLILLFNYV